MSNSGILAIETAQNKANNRHSLDVTNGSFLLYLQIYLLEAPNRTSVDIINVCL